MAGGQVAYYTAAVTRRKGFQERAAELFAELTQGEEEAVEFVRNSLSRELGLEVKDHGNGAGG